MSLIGSKIAGRRSSVVFRRKNRNIFQRHTICDIRHAINGFTLVEVMVATAVLALGSVMIFEAFFRSADANDFSRSYLSMIPQMEEKMWRAQDSIRIFGEAGPILTKGVFSADNREYPWELTYEVLVKNEIVELYSIEMKVSLEYAGKIREMSRNAYSVHKKKEKK